MSPRCHIVDPIDRDDGGSMNAEGLVLNFKKGMAESDDEGETTTAKAETKTEKKDDEE